MTRAGNNELPIGKPKRSGPITAASILGWVLGGLCLIGAIIAFPFAAFWAKLLPQIPQIPEVPFFGVLTPSVFIALGVVCLICGALYIVAGIHLWRCKRRGRILGIAAGILGIISSFFPPSGFSYIAMFPDIALITLIAIRWGNLTA